MGERCAAGTTKLLVENKVRPRELVQPADRHVLFSRSLKLITSSWTNSAVASAWRLKNTETGLRGVVFLSSVWQPSAETRTVFVPGFSALRCWTGSVPGASGDIASNVRTPKQNRYSCCQPGTCFCCRGVKTSRTLRQNHTVVS